MQDYHSFLSYKHARLSQLLDNTLELGFIHIWLVLGLFNLQFTTSSSFIHHIIEMEYLNSLVKMYLKSDFELS